MSPEENEIALDVECSHLSAFEFGHRREKRLEHASNSVSESSGEVVKYQFWVVGGRASVTLWYLSVLIMLKRRHSQ